MPKGYNAAEVLTMAVELERMGKSFYDAILHDLDDPRAREIFQILSDDEVRHEKLFQDMMHAVAPAGASEPGDPEIIAYFRELMDSRIFPSPSEILRIREKLGDPAAGIRIALTFEKDSILFFHEMLVFAPDDDQPVIKQIIDEERDHLLRILKLKQDLKL
ncbi:MAG TPA: hypothetical protein ENN17_06585 [bacterium]|nr:hypothetical protein [bacterium]